MIAAAEGVSVRHALRPGHLPRHRPSVDDGRLRRQDGAQGRQGRDGRRRYHDGAGLLPLRRRGEEAAAAELRPGRGDDAATGVAPTAVVRMPGMQLDFFVVQLLTGLASAASLFLVASGLSMIFGVTRIVNFAHGAFYMLGAYIACHADRSLGSGPLGFWGGMVAAAARGRPRSARCRDDAAAPHLPRAGAVPAARDLRRRPWSSQDLVLLIWGPEDLLGPRAPGLARARSGARPARFRLRSVSDRARPGRARRFFGCSCIAPAGACWSARRRRTATWSAALGVNQKWLFTSVFALGIVACRPRRRAAAAARRRQSRDGSRDHRRSVRRRRDRRARQRRPAHSSPPCSSGVLNAFGILVLPESHRSSSSFS